MGRQLNISEMGLKLIKAYEGYRPVDRTLVSGQRVVGYGHRLMSEDAMVLSREQAEELLKDDLAPFIDMINENVHAPLTQSQFDALCSFAYNIGPKAFLKSDTLRALNNGRPLDAANGLDIWRKSEIDGKTYVVDALMRRRTAEKALFLRPEGGPVSASGADIFPVSDETVALLSTEDALPVFTKEDSVGVVATVPYEAAASQYRRREDGPAGILTLSEVFDEDDYEVEDVSPASDILDLDDIVQDTQIDENRPSLIAIEDDKLKDRLDALIGDVKSEAKAIDTQDWPESLITVDKTDDKIVPFRKGEASSPQTQSSDLQEAEMTADIVIDNLREDDALRARTEDSASRFIDLNARDEIDEKVSTLPYIIMLVIGALLLGSSGAVYLKNPTDILGEHGPLLTISGIFIGSMMLLGALYYALRQSFRKP